MECDLVLSDGELERQHRAKRTAYMRVWRSKNHEKVKARKRAAHHRDKLAMNAKSRAYYYANKKQRIAKGREYARKRRLVDPAYRLRVNMRRSLLLRLGGKVKGGKMTREYLGCSIEELKAHLERQFKPGMSWDNYGYHGWHVDHMIPCASFDLRDPEQVKKCFGFRNLQPLWKLENFEKRDKILPEIAFVEPGC